MTTTLPAMSAEAVAALRTGVLILSRRMRYQPSEEELSPSEAAVLGRLGREGAMTPGALARAEHVQPPSMTKIIERLESRALVGRTVHAADRRQVLIHRTPAGDTLVERSRERRTAWLTTQLARLPADELRLLEAASPVLARLAELPEI